MERITDKRELVALLTRSPHGDLKSYLPVAQKAATDDPEFYARLIAWNHRKGQIRDAKVALPVIALLNRQAPAAAIENALAHLADLPPRMLLKGLDFLKDCKGPDRVIRRLVARYLRDLEGDWHRWERTALQHRDTLTALYSRWHIEAGGAKYSLYESTLFGPSGKVKDRQRPTRGKFAIVRQLPNLSPTEISGLITKHRIPFTIARGALGAKAKEIDVTMALITAMSDTELVTNMKALKRLGVQTVPALRATLEARLEKAGSKKRAPKTTLKTTAAAEAVADDDVLSAKLHALQERQLDNMGSVAGRWLIIADKSASMDIAIEAANQIAAVLARMATEVALVYVDIGPRFINATGKTYEELKAATSMMKADGGTSIGVGLDYALQMNAEVDGVAIISDGGENQQPFFSDVYERYSKTFDKRVPVYWFQVRGDMRGMLNTVAQQRFRRNAYDAELRQAEVMLLGEISRFKARAEAAKIQLETFELTGGVDYYSLPNLVKTLRTNRYSLVDEIMAVPLATLDVVLDKTVGMRVLAQAGNAFQRA